MPGTLLNIHKNKWDADFCNYVCQFIFGISYDTYHLLMTSNEKNHEAILGALLTLQIRDVDYKISKDYIGWNTWIGLKSIKTKKYINLALQFLQKVNSRVDLPSEHKNKIISETATFTNKANQYNNQGTNKHASPNGKFNYMHVDAFLRKKLSNNEEWINFIKANILPNPEPAQRLLSAPASPSLAVTPTNSISQSTIMNSLVPTKLDFDKTMPPYCYKGDNLNLKYKHKKRPTALIEGNMLHKELFVNHLKAESVYGSDRNILIANIGFLVIINQDKAQSSHFISFYLDDKLIFDCSDINNFKQQLSEFIQIYNSKFAENNDASNSAQSFNHSELAFYQYIFSERVLLKIRDALFNQIASLLLIQKPKIKSLIVDLHSSSPMCPNCAHITFGISSTNNSFRQQIVKTFSEKFNFSKDTKEYPRILCRYSYSRDTLLYNRGASIKYSIEFNELCDAELKDIKDEYRNMLILHSKNPMIVPQEPNRCLFFSGSGNMKPFSLNKKQISEQDTLNLSESFSNSLKLQSTVEVNATNNEKKNDSLTMSSTK